MCQSYCPRSPQKSLALSLLVIRCAGHNSNLASESNISKTVRVNIAFTRTFFKEYCISFLMESRLIDFALVVLFLLMLKVCGVKIVFFCFSWSERIKQNKKY